MMNGKLHDREGNTMSARTRYSHKLFLQQLFFIIFHDVNFHALFVMRYASSRTKTYSQKKWAGGEKVVL